MQFLYEAGYGSPLVAARSGAVGVTQPRRVAVLSTAKRIADELNTSVGKQVGFQVRGRGKEGGRKVGLMNMEGTREEGLRGRV